jgi:RHO1 GDP-GTP exchange protein 1/2
LKTADPEIIPQSRLKTFIPELYGNIDSILIHHQRMLAALFVRQREQHPLVQSIADIILDSKRLD